MDIRAQRLLEGYCYNCCAFKSNKCLSMTEGCPVPEDVLKNMKKNLELKKKRKGRK